MGSAHQSLFEDSSCRVGNRFSTYLESTNSDSIKFHIYYFVNDRFGVRFQSVNATHALKRSAGVS